MSAAPARVMGAPAAAAAAAASPAAPAAANVGGAAAAASLSGARPAATAAARPSGHSEKLLPFIAGSAGGIVSTALLQPLDVIRTRLQLPATQTAATAGVAPRVGGIVATVRNIVANESITGLWKGGVPSTLRVGFGAGLYFQLQNMGLALARQLSTAGGNQPVVSASVTTAIGSGARIVAAVICMPISVIKTRFEAAATRQYNSVWHALRTISQREGVRGLYAGIGPTLTRDAPYAGLHLLFYTRTKAALSKAAAAAAPAGSGAAAGASAASPAVAYALSAPALQFASGFVAGGAATAITHPFDVVKTRIQIERLTRLSASAAGAGAAAGGAGAGAPLTYSGSAPLTLWGSRSLGAARAVLLESGPVGLTAGMLPRMLKRALSNGISWSLYEQIVAAGRGRTML